MAVRRASGYADGLISGATWGLVAVLLAGVSARMAEYSAVATSLVIATLHDGAATVFLLARAGLTGTFGKVTALIGSRNSVAIAACAVLGGPVFMGGYVVALVLAGPSYALTATATYPVFGALFAQRLLRQRLTAMAWLGVTLAAAGAALTAFDATSAVDGVRTLIGVGIALAAAAGLALEGIVATHAMSTVDADTAMAVRELFSLVMFGVIVAAVPGGISVSHAVLVTPGLVVPLTIAGFVGGYSFAIWYHSIRKIGVAKAMALNISYALFGTVLAWAFQHAATSVLAVAGCLIVTAGAAITIMSGEKQEDFQEERQPR